MAVTALVACLSPLMAGLVSDTALATPATDRGAQLTWEDGKVVSAEVPADLRADEQAGVNAQTETGKASVANPEHLPIQDTPLDQPVILPSVAGSGAVGKVMPPSLGAMA